MNSADRTQTGLASRAGAGPSAGRWWPVYLLAGGALVGALALLLHGSATCRSSSPHVESTLSTWRAAGLDRAFNRRYDLLPEVLGKVVVEGMSRSDVLACLGLPEEETGDEVFYIVGKRSGFGIDHVFLHVEFDSTDRVVRYYVMQH